MGNRGLVAVLWVLGLVVAVVLIGANLFLGDLNQDEGWYLYAARLVSEGNLPYVDFATTQGPVMPFVYAAAQPVVDRWGMAGGRMFTAVLGFAGALSGAWLASRSAARSVRSVAALTAFLLISINVYHSYFTTIVKTYALAGLLLVLGFLFLTCMGDRRGWAAFLSGVFLMLAAGTRTSAAFVIPVVFLLLLRHDLKMRCLGGSPQSGAKGLPYRGDWLRFFFGVVLTAFVLYVPFLLKAPAAVWFALVEYHVGREAGSLLKMSAYKAGFLSRVVYAYFPAVILGLCAFFHAALRRPVAQPKAQVGSPVLLMLWLSSLAVTLVHFMAPFPYDDYQAVIYPLFAVAVAVTVTRMATENMAVAVQENVSGPRGAGQTGIRGPWYAARNPDWFLLVVFALCAAFAFSSPMNQKWFAGKRDRIWWPLKEEAPLTMLQKTAAFVMEKMPVKPGDLLLTQDPYLAVETGLVLPRGLELGQFSYFPGWSVEKADQCHVLNRETFRKLLSTCDATVAAFSGYGLSIGSPEVTRLPEAEQRELWAIVEDRYRLVMEVEPFGQADTKLRILRSKEQ